MFTWLIDNIIGNIPVWAWTAVAGAGAAGYVISGLIAKMPFAQAKALALLVKIVGILAVVGGIFMCGGSGVLAIEQNAIKEMQDKVAKAELASADANAKLDDALKNKTKTVNYKECMLKIKSMKKKS